jgi:hypothetical protein
LRREYDSKRFIKLSLTEEFLTGKFLKDGIMLVEPEKLISSDSYLKVNGFIGDLRIPFANHRETLVLKEDSLPIFDRIDDDCSRL